MFFPRRPLTVHIAATKLLHKGARSQVTSYKEQDFRPPGPGPAEKHLKTDYSSSLI
jgi:hypothetical protein